VDGHAHPAPTKAHKEHCVRTGTQSTGTPIAGWRVLFHVEPQATPQTPTCLCILSRVFHMGDPGVALAISWEEVQRAVRARWTCKRQRPCVGRKPQAPRTHTGWQQPITEAARSVKQYGLYTQQTRRLPLCCTGGGGSCAGLTPLAKTKYDAALKDGVFRAGTVAFLLQHRSQDKGSSPIGRADDNARRRHNTTTLKTRKRHQQEQRQKEGHEKGNTYQTQSMGTSWTQGAWRDWKQRPAQNKNSHTQS